MSRVSDRARAVVALLLLAACLLQIPGWNPPTAVLVLLFGVAATGVNVMFGLAGMLTLGNGSFIVLAGYGTVLSIERFNVPPLLAALIGLATVIAFVAIVSRPLVRLPGVYFAVATVGLTIALGGLVRAFPETTGGSSGLTVSRRISFGFFSVGSDLSWLLLSAVVAALVAGAARWLSNGRTGRTLRLMQHDELAATVMGVKVRSVKAVVLLIGALMTGIGGILLTFWQGVIVPESGDFLASTNLLAMAVVGGLGAWLGGFLGAALLITLNDALRSVSGGSELLYGLLFLAVMVFAPGGLANLFDFVISSAQGALRRSPRDGADVPPVRVAEAEPRVPDSPVRAAVSDEAWADGSTSGLVVSHAVKSYGGVVAVNDVSLHAPAAAVTALIGGNGAGKSTLMNIVSGIETLDSGSVMLNGQHLGGFSAPDRARLGVQRTFQVPRLVPRLTTWENVALGDDAVQSHVFFTRREQELRVRARAEQALAQAGLAHLSGRLASTLGTGERKFVEVVRALGWGPAVLLMDEPAVGLTGQEIARLRNWVRELANAGAAILIVDHNMDFVSDVADYVYEMTAGAFTRQGTIAEMRLTSRGRATAPDADSGH